MAGELNNYAKKINAYTTSWPKSSIGTSLAHNLVLNGNKLFHPSLFQLYNLKCKVDEL